MAGDAPRRLRARDCYVGQRVYWIMWVDEQDARPKRDWHIPEGLREPVMGWFAYRDGLSPEIWSARVVAAHRNGTIMLDGYGKALSVYACESDAILGEYRAFCSMNMEVGWRGADRLCNLGEASRVLRILAELEYGLHESVRLSTQEEATDGR